MDEDLKQYLNEMKGELTGRLDRAAEAFATEVGKLHTQMQENFDEVNRRLRRVDANTNMTAEVLARQSRWHEESDNAIHDAIKRQADTDKRLDELRGRIEKLEGGSGKAA